MSEPQPRPVLSGIGGGLGARVAALATLVALAAVVWVGVSAKPVPSPTEPSPAVAAQASPTATPPQPSARPSPPPSAQASPGSPRPPAPIPNPTWRPSGNRTVAVTGAVGDGPFYVGFTEVRPGVFVAEHWTHSPPASDVLQFELWELRRRGERSVSIGTWGLSLAELAGNARAGTSVLTATAPARPSLRRAPLAVQRGFELEVSVRLAFQEVAVVYFELRIGAPVRNQVQGDDGFMGCRGFLTCDFER